MKSSSILIVILTIATIGFGVSAYNLIGANDEYKRKQTLLNNTNTKLVDELSAVKASFSELQNEFKENKAFIVSLNDQLLNLKSKALPMREVVIESKPTDAMTQSTSSNLPKNADVGGLRELAKMLKPGKGISSIEEGFRENFKEEEVDSGWAYEYESKIRDLVAAEESNSFNVQELTCKTTACEMKISADNNSAMSLGMLFMKSIGEQDWRDENATVIFNSKVKDGVMSILIGRNKNSFN